jgi:hypothetical protein
MSPGPCFDCQGLVTRNLWFCLSLAAAHILFFLVINQASSFVKFGNITTATHRMLHTGCRNEGVSSAFVWK